MKISYSTIQLLRFPFSLFLMPVYFFALGLQPDIYWPHAILIFLVLHVLVYPASNGYNSFMDRDDGPIGGLKNPLPPTKQLFYTTVVLDFAAVVLGLLVHVYASLALLVYILMSRAYSYRGIRLKKYPVAGYLTVVFFQGAFIFCLVYFASGQQKIAEFPFLPALASSLLIGGFYPLTQIYQHEADRKDGVTTISMLLGVKGTFLFSGIIYFLAFACLFFYFSQEQRLAQFYLLTTLLLPVLVYFIRWAVGVWKSPIDVDYQHSLKMNVLASVCTTICIYYLTNLEYH